MASFVIQDGIDSIRVTCWGEATLLVSTFRVGDCVQLCAPEIKVRTSLSQVLPYSYQSFQSKRQDRYASETTAEYELSFGGMGEGTIQLTPVSEKELNRLSAPINPHSVPIGNVLNIGEDEAAIVGVVGAVSTSHLPIDFPY